MFLANTGSGPRADSPAIVRIVRNFTPNWFTVTMGTGALPLVLNQYPLHVPGLHAVATTLWAVNAVLFTLFAVLYLAHWIFFFGEARAVFRHPVMSMFFGAIPMALTTVANGFIAFGPEHFGPAAYTVAHVLWWVVSGMSLLCGLLIPYFMFTRQDHSIEKLTAVWLLPIVAAEVAAASGGLLAPHLSDAGGFTVLMLSYALWAYSVPLALSLLGLLFLRLALHKLPGRDLGVSGWLALGPIGTGAMGLVVLGNAAPDIFAAQGGVMASVGPVAQGVGIIGGTVLWGYGIWWLSLAVIKTARYMLGEGLPFNLGWWGFTFPLAVYTLGTMALAQTTHFGLFSVMGDLLASCLTLFWVIVAVRTLAGAVDGRLFAAPYMQPTPWAAGIRAEAA